MEDELELLILGLGNLLCGDDGAGVEAAARVHQRYLCPPGVRVLDGGTLGLSLLPWIQSARTLLILDAVLADAPPGTVVRLDGEAVGPAVRARLSVHQVGVADLLDSARLLGGRPERVTLLGVVPASMELVIGLSCPVEAALPAVVEAAAEEARRLGLALLPREGGHAEPGLGLGGAALHERRVPAAP